MPDGNWEDWERGSRRRRITNEVGYPLWVIVLTFGVGLALWGHELLHYPI